jgi:polyribonucleotide nucleotidyltransferase
MSDIVGLEDFSGEMDFKIAGTYDGITAIQLDVKNEGLTEKMIHEIFEQGLNARRVILDFMNEHISKANTDISQYAPKVVIVQVPTEKIGEIIGPGGKNIKALIARTNCDINIDDDGNVTISGIDRKMVEEAVQHIKSTTREIEVGETFEGEVKRLLPFGAFVEMLPGRIRQKPS